MKLDKTQKRKIKELVAAGYESDQINELAAQYDPPFSVSRQQVEHYRRNSGPKLKAILEAKKDSPLKQGLAIKENRVSLLQKLADAMHVDLIENQKLWVVDKIITVNNEPVEVESFNHQEMNQLRGVLDDLAKETGGRKVIEEMKHTGQVEILVRRTNATPADD